MLLLGDGNPKVGNLFCGGAGASAGAEVEAVSGSINSRLNQWRTSCTYKRSSYPRTTQGEMVQEGEGCRITRGSVREPWAAKKIEIRSKGYGIGQYGACLRGRYATYRGGRYGYLLMAARGPSTRSTRICWPGCSSCGSLSSRMLLTPLLILVAARMVP